MELERKISAAFCFLLLSTRDVLYSILCAPAKDEDTLPHGLLLSLDWFRIDIPSKWCNFWMPGAWRELNGLIIGCLLKAADTLIIEFLASAKIG